MFKFVLYSLQQFDMLEKIILSNMSQNTVFLCVGTKKYVNDSFGVVVGDKLKNIKVISFGSSKREINGTNFLKVFKFIKQKYKNYKTILIDSAYFNADNSPILVYQNYGIIPSAINSNIRIGDAGILFNSFSYTRKEIVDEVVYLLENMIKKFAKN